MPSTSLGIGTSSGATAPTSAAPIVADSSSAKHPSGRSNFEPAPIRRTPRGTPPREPALPVDLSWRAAAGQPEAPEWERCAAPAWRRRCGVQAVGDDAAFDEQLVAAVDGV